PVSKALARRCSSSAVQREPEPDSGIAGRRSGGAGGGGDEGPAAAAPSTARIASNNARTVSGCWYGLSAPNFSPVAGCMPFASAFRILNVCSLFMGVLRVWVGGPEAAREYAPTHR